MKTLFSTCQCSLSGVQLLTLDEIKPVNSKYYAYEWSNAEFVEKPDAKPIKLNYPGDFFYIKTILGYQIIEAKSGMNLGKAQKTINGAVEYVNNKIEENLAKLKVEFADLIVNSINKHGLSPRYAEGKPDLQKSEIPDIKFKDGQLVSYKGGAEWKPVMMIKYQDWDTTGWHRYNLIDSEGKIIEKYAAENSLELRTDKLAEKLFKINDPAIRKKMIVTENENKHTDSIIPIIKPEPIVKGNITTEPPIYKVGDRVEFIEHRAYISDATFKRYIGQQGTVIELLPKEYKSRQYSGAPLKTIRYTNYKIELDLTAQILYNVGDHVLKPLEKIEPSKPVMNVRYFINFLQEHDIKFKEFTDVMWDQCAILLDKFTVNELPFEGDKTARIEKTIQMCAYKALRNEPDYELSLKAFSIKKFISEAFTEAMMMPALWIPDEKEAYKQAIHKAMQSGLIIPPYALADYRMLDQAPGINVLRMKMKAKALKLKLKLT